MNDYPTNTIQLNGIDLAERVEGTGEPILLLHGWGANIGLVWQLAEGLIKLGYRCYAIDLSGFGKSPEPPQAWTVYDYANLVLAYLDYHQLEQVYLFGHSFGGRLGLILGAEHGERIKKMALSDAAGIRPKEEFLPSLRLKVYKGIRDGLVNIGLKSFSEQLRQVYNKAYGSSDFNAVSGVMRQTMVNVVNEDLLPYAARVKASTILFWGSKDEDTPLWMGQTLEKTIPDAGLVVHQGAGHYAYLERLAETIRVMDYFFSQDKK